MINNKNFDKKKPLILFVDPTLSTASPVVKFTFLEPHSEFVVSRLDAVTSVNDVGTNINAEVST